MPGSVGDPAARSGRADGSADAAEDLWGGIDDDALFAIDGNGGGDGASSAASAPRSARSGAAADGTGGSAGASSAAPAPRSPPRSSSVAGTAGATCDGKCPVCAFVAKGDDGEKRRKALDQHVRAKKDTLHTSYRENGGTGPVRMRDEDWESFIAKQPKALRTAANELREKAAQLQLGDELAWSLRRCTR